MGSGARGTVSIPRRWRQGQVRREHRRCVHLHRRVCSGREKDVGRGSLREADVRCARIRVERLGPRYKPHGT